MIKKLSLVLLIAALMLTVTGCSATDYKTATELMDNGNPAAASEMFKALGNYKDSASLATACDYTVAKSAYDAGDFEQAAALFTVLGSYEDSEAMASQASDKALAKKLVGNWVSAEADVTDLIIDSTYNVIRGDEDAETFLNSIDFDKLTLRFNLTFTEKGTFVIEPDESSAAAMADDLYQSFSDGVYTFMESAFTQAAEENGMTLDDLMRGYGCSTFEELFVIAVGDSFDNFVSSILPKDQLMAVTDEGTINGVYTVTNGRVEFSYGKGEVSYAEYDMTTDTFILTDGDISVTSLIFSRA